MATGDASGGELGSIDADESCTTVSGADSLPLLVFLLLLLDSSLLPLIVTLFFPVGDTLFSIPTALGRRTLAVSSCSRSWRRRSRAESVDDGVRGCCSC